MQVRCMSELVCILDPSGGADVYVDNFPHLLFDGLFPVVSVLRLGM